MVLKKSNLGIHSSKKYIGRGVSSQLEEIISNLGIHNISHNISHHIAHPVRVASGGTFQIRVY